MWPDQPKSLRSEDARDERRRYLACPHMEELTKYVKGLRARVRARRRGTVQDFDPFDGGTNATLLVVLQNPGRGARDSGFISRDNDDRTAPTLFDLLGKTGVTRRDRTALWNIVPWFSELPIDADLDDGARELEQVIQRLPHLRAIVFLGCKIEPAARRVRLPRGVRAFFSVHPSPKTAITYPNYRDLILEKLRLASRYRGLRPLNRAHAAAMTARVVNGERRGNGGLRRGGKISLK
jgi:hypothetical protein